ncbi:energy-coupling factor transporter transmembrane protein EcfT [Clostridium sp. MSJ-4]|uniref:Energy-coupling factor transporter transmembrane protein EcfT n=1 Tax=Clostridium simiarum TaxID=2841506 RepID=A0ABS6F3D4_9CLOT|nr:energy-coupling factor transporter transmembrane component T [Clostridium simiarum]MBU5593026.1 energy-coupling factor transporter transmembrane protein EcfT [Clostridium simiarum]
MNVISIMDGDSKSRLIELDPRTKIFVLVLCNVIIFLAPSMEYEMILIFSALIFAVLCGVYKFALKMGIVYVVLIGIQYLSALYLPIGGKILIVTFTSFARKLFPSAVLGKALISTTKVNEFMAAMNKFKVPKSILIPMAVTLRYFPMAMDDIGNIKNAMKVRGIFPSIGGFLRRPEETIEHVYVPMIVSASKIADEMSQSAIARGIDSPTNRTSLEKIGFGTLDIVCGVYFLGLLIKVLM